MIYEVFGNPLLIFAFFLISIFWILVVIGLRFQELRFFRSLTGNGETSLTSLGIFFTFLGIFLALSNFDTGNIQESIPLLLESLRLAFGSSVFGLFAALSLRIFFRPLFTPASNSDGATPDDILEELKNLNETNLSVREAISGDGDGSLSTQLSKLRNDFQDFAKKVGEDGARSAQDYANQSRVLMLQICGG